MTGNLRIRDKILIVLSRKHCLSLEELEKHTGVKRDILKVYLSQLARQGIVTRSWGSFGGKKYRKYCLKSSIKEELGVEWPLNSPVKLDFDVPYPHVTVSLNKFSFFVDEYVLTWRGHCIFPRGVQKRLRNHDFQLFLPPTKQNRVGVKTLRIHDYVTLIVHDSRKIRISVKDNVQLTRESHMSRFPSGHRTRA